MGKWIHQRKAFGKPLVDLAVLRAKMANMFARIEALQAWLENITYQMCHMTYAQQADLLSGQIGLLKQQCTRVAGEVADDATQIFGGRGLTQSGMGIFIERFQRTQKFDACSEEPKRFSPTSVSARPRARCPRPSSKRPTRLAC